MTDTPLVPLPLLIGVILMLVSWIGLFGCRPHPQPYRACLNEPGYQVVGPGKQVAWYSGCGQLLMISDEP